MKNSTRTMKLLRALVGATPLVLAGCMAQPLPAEDTGTTQSFVGPWRVAVAEQTQIFSDYVFEVSGKVTLLRSVAFGQVVDPMQGAGVVHGTGGSAPTCAFGKSWSTFDGATLVLDGDCTDGAARELELAVVGTQARDVQTVTVAAVDGARDWMAPATWRFQSCAARPCGD